MFNRFAGFACVLSLVTGVGLGPASAQTAQAPAGTFTLPPVVVTAQKEPADPQTLPVSVTIASGDRIRATGARIVSDAATRAPNTYFSEFSARKLSNPRFRGIGASPANPAITTYYDGVPQLHANAASLDLLDIAQIEFVRGPQSALFGRNALGGVINVVSERPSLGEWSGRLSVPLANADAWDIRGSASGPVIAGRLGAAMSLQYGRRDGYTTNDVTGNDVDSRSAFAAKGQLLWVPAFNWETRVIVTGERARDGDYALSDLGGLRRNAYRTARDFEGYTHRDVFGATILNTRAGTRVSVSTTTGVVWWETDDATDLDYTPLPLVTRSNLEESVQFTQEVRVASAANRPVRLSDEASLRWQAGVFLFTQNYDQDAVNGFSPFVLSPFIPLAVRQTSPRAALDDVGIGVFGQGTITVRDSIDVTAGARFDHEQKDGVLATFFSPAIAPAREVRVNESFSNVSPQLAVAARVRPGHTVYASVARGYKAGGFNAAAPGGGDAYGEEHTWSFEGGLKTAWADDRVRANLSLFRINWDDLQLNLPDPGVPGQFFIANVGGATSSGVELEVSARLRPSVDVFAGIGYTRARFDPGSLSSGVDVGGNAIPNTPEYTASLGLAVTRDLGSAVSVYGRAEGAFFGAFQYDDLNRAGQEAYALADFRGGVRRRQVFMEVWVRNAFDTHYIPVAFAYGALAPSGFLGEMGRPRTFGVTSGVTF